MDKKLNIAVYPGTFDPLTNGHCSLIHRGLRIFDQVVVAPAADTPKSPLFTLEERVAMAQDVFRDEPRVVVEPFYGLLVDFVQTKGAAAILRGLRAVSDFEYEFQMALMNRRLKRDIQTVFLMTDYRWLFISSTIIKDVVRLGGEVGGLVPAEVKARLIRKFAKLS
ncbi:MAG: pantetheine-phosphate adenylyltransferase [Deltaproteobacteria bacterium]|nr:pantetheine-phosphate adenylyltransferase [Deltaproteobacteria bacterium]